MIQVWICRTSMNKYSGSLRYFSPSSPLNELHPPPTRIPPPPISFHASSPTTATAAATARLPLSLSSSTPFLLNHVHVHDHAQPPTYPIARTRMKNKSISTISNPVFTPVLTHLLNLPAYSSIVLVLVLDSFTYSYDIPCLLLFVSFRR